MTMVMTIRNTGNLEYLYYEHGIGFMRTCRVRMVPEGGRVAASMSLLESVDMVYAVTDLALCLRSPIKVGKLE